MLKQLVHSAILTVSLSSMTFAATTNTLSSASSSQPATPATTPASASTKTTQKTPAQQSHTWNLQDVDIATVVDEVSRETGKNFIIDPRVSGKVTIISSQPMNADELSQVFNDALAVQGFSVVSVGPNTDKVVPSQDAQASYDVNKAERFAPNGAVVVNVVPIQNVSAEQLVPILRPLLPSWAIVSAYAPSNVIILSGNASDVRNVTNLIQKVDVVSNSKYEVVPLQYATAKDVVTTLNSLLSATRETGAPQMISIAPDTRTNSVIMSGDQIQRMRMRILIAALDSKPQSDENNDVNIVHLHYLNALQFAPVLANVAQASMALAAGKPIPTSGASAPASTTSSQPLLQSTDSSSSTSGDESSSQASTSSGTEDDSAAYSSPMIQPEVNSNSLIITAPPALLHTLKNIIAQLDVRPSQVLVEAAIVELSADDLQRLGVQFGSVPSEVTGANGQKEGGTDFQNFVGIIQNGSWRWVISALQNDTNANILSTPSVMALNNHQAIISVGKQQGVTSGSYVTPGSGGSNDPYTTTSRQNFDLSLSVTPQVTDQLIQMAIDQQDNRLADTPGQDVTPGKQDQADDNPTTNHTEIKTSVLVNNGDILVLGGLIDDDDNNTVQKLPLLGDIPLLGHIFSYRTKDRNKKSLMMFLHPVIIDSEGTAEKVTSARYGYIRNLQLAWQQKNSEGVPLPAWKANIQLPKPFEDE